MARTDIAQLDVLTAIVSRLQTALALGDSRCYAVARPLDLPEIPPGGDYWLTVAPGDGRFEPEEQVPGQAATESRAAVPGNVTEYGEVVVSGYTRIRTDQSSTDTYLLLDDARGLLQIKRNVLTALCGQDLTDSDGNTFLRQLVFAKHAGSPDLVEGRAGEIRLGRIQLTFGISWDWSLT